jgi:hypothetical protein
MNSQHEDKVTREETETDAPGAPVLGRASGVADSTGGMPVRSGVKAGPFTIEARGRYGRLP